MASLAPELKPSFCAEKQRLVEAFTTTVNVYLRMQAAQAQAVIDGLGFEFDAEIHHAHKQKDAARLAIVEHQRKHGC